MSEENVNTEARPIAVVEELPKRERAVMPAPVNPDATPMQMLAIMTQRGVSMADLKELVALAKDWEANQARKAFIAAKAAFKKNPPKVIKDRINTQYKSKYASLGNFANTVNMFLGEHGLEASWPLKQEGANITVSCRLSHVMGHSEEVELTSGPDASGSKNPLQGIRSTITYLEIATLQAITGIVASDDDDDGNASGQKPRGPEPAGYENWAADMEALAEEGIDRLQAAWKATTDDYRRYVVKHDDLWWADMKRKAAKVKVPS